MQTVTKGKRKVSQRVVKKYIFVATALAYPGLLFFVFFCGTSFGSIIMSFQKIDYAGNATWNGLENFKTFIKFFFGADDRVTIGVKNALILYGMSLIMLPFNLLQAYLIFKKCWGHAVMRALIMIPSIVSSLLMGRIFMKVVDWIIPSIMINTFGATDVPNLLQDPSYAFWTCWFYGFWSGGSGAIIIYPNAMAATDKEIYEAAKIDGVCTMWQEMWYIILPMMYPTLSTILITGFAGALMNSGSLTIFYKYSAPVEAYTLGYHYFVQVANAKSQVAYPPLAAGGLLLTAVITPLTLFLRWFLDKHDPMEG
ncbi:MAG: sugar ABC transporter permease [Clostridia bacterium]|nr:sugar ABC transporter permease [Clostridia bacterium]